MSDGQTIDIPAFLTALFEGASDGLCLVAPDGTILRANQAWLRSTGLFAEQVVGADILELFPETRELAREVHARARAGERVRGPAHRQSILGRETWWDGSVAPVPMAGGTGLLITAREISQLRSQPLRDALRAGQDVLRLVIEGSPSPVALLDRGLRYLAVSPSWLQAAGLPASPVGRALEEVFPGHPERWLAVYARALAGEQVTVPEDTWVRRDGSVHHFAWRCQPWRSAEGEVGGILIQAELLTARMVFEAALSASEQRHRSLFEHLEEDASIYELERDGGGQVTDWILRAANASARRRVGEATSAAMLGRRLSQLIPADQARAAVAGTEALLAGGVRTERLHVALLGHDYLASSFAVDARTVVVVAANLGPPGLADPADPAPAATLARTVARLRESIEAADGARGFLRICMHCHGIRTSEGAWEPLLEHLSRRSGTLLSHGVCDACFAARYPEDAR